MNDLLPVLDRSRIADISGEVFGKLTVVEPAGIRHWRSGMAVYFRCRCECGGEIIIQRSNLRHGKVRSCGCEKRSVRTQPDLAWSHPLYKTWMHMMDRCDNPRNKSFKDYGARGIAVCQKWRTGDGQLTGFECFAVDMGDKPSPDSMVERRNNDLGYSPENCAWAYRQEQNSNKRSNVRVTIGEETKTVAEWTRHFGLSEFLVYRRIALGWNPVDAVLTPRLR